MTTTLQSTTQPATQPASQSASQSASRELGENVERYQVTADQYRAFRRDGFVVVRGLVSKAEVDELRQHTEDLMQGRLPEQQAAKSQYHGSSAGAVLVNDFGAPPDHLSQAEKAQFFLRIHMLHRKMALHERYLLHPRVLDVLEVLIGPDVMAMQTMLFLKPPGKPGQGWHQDSYYIPTHPDTLCGAWIAIDDCDELNGAMWFAKGSGTEPIYPPCPEIPYGFGDKLVSDITYVKGVSNPDDSVNMLTRVADRYDQALVSARAGDVVFFNGHVLHRSKQNYTTDRFRRAFVSHYANARSFTQWGADTGAPPPVLTSESGVGSFTEKRQKDGDGKPLPRREPAAQGQPEVAPAWAQDPVTKMTNGSHILARGDTHLPFARPRFGSPCAALQTPEERKKASEYAARVIALTNNGLLGCAIAEPKTDDDETPTKEGGGY